MDLSGYLLDKLREDAEFMLYRARRPDASAPILVRAPASRNLESTYRALLQHEYSLSEELDRTWALRPLALARHDGCTVLLLVDPGGKPLDGLLGQPLEMTQFLNIAVGLAAALRQVHHSGFIHKDVRPANVFVEDNGNVRVTGFGLATRMPREHQVPVPPDVLAGTMAYMSPEQTGRMNRSIDNRSDLYSLGVTLYEMLVGALPFTATDPMEWIYCHVARAPPPPSVRVENMPAVLEAIVLKLLAKNAEDRYQTASGLEHDLRRCLSAWNADRRMEPFAPAAFDVADRLPIPEKLYGRDATIDVLVDAFEHVSKQGQFEFVLVSGHSGVGKSSVVNELSRAILPARCLFAVGKFDQYKRNIPYATLVEAFQEVVRHILSQADAELERWRAALQNAVGVNGQLVIDLFPKFGLILGEQPPVPGVPPQEEKTRFQLVFRRFVGVFAQASHPLVLFLDDLQWLDEATLELLELLATGEGIPYLLLIGAYRSNEVDSSHILGRMLDAIRAPRCRLKEIILAPLTPGDVGQLLADALHAKLDEVQSLTELVFQKTQGNPFAVVQFLASLHADRLIQFDDVTQDWRWDDGRIRGKRMIDNVAELVTGKLTRFEDSTLTVIKQFACLGNDASTATLSKVLGVSEEAIDSELRDVVGAGLIHRLERGYAFAHDRVREAAYALVTEQDRASIHLAIGRLLAQGTGQKELEQSIFEIVNQANRGVGLITSPEEILRLAELNLIAGKRAKAATAYESALTYLQTGLVLLGPDAWSKQYRTTFEMELHRAECKFMIGDVRFAEECLKALSAHCVDPADLALIIGRQMMVYTNLGDWEHAIDLSIGSLARMGVALPLHPSDELVDREYQQLCKWLGHRTVDDLYDLPEMVDAHSVRVMGILEELLAPAGRFNTNLQHLVILRMINISMEHGTSDETCHAYACCGGLVLGWRFGDFSTGHALGRLALRLVNERRLDRHAARVLTVIAGTTGPWSMPLRECYNLAARASDMGRQQGGITYNGYAWAYGLATLLDCGSVLSDVHRHADAALALARSVKFPLVVDFINSALMMVRALRGLTADLATISDGSVSEEEHERRLDSSPKLWHAAIRYRIRKLQLQLIAGNFARCLELVSRMDEEVDELKVYELAEYRYYAALTRAACLADMGDEQRKRHVRMLVASGEQFSQWESRCPDNFAGRAALIAAEIARIEGRELEAERLYERAIERSRTYGLIHDEAIANEVAARFYAHRGFGAISDLYLRNARSCYSRWEADGKVRQLDLLHPHLTDEAAVRATVMSTPANRFQQLDLPAVVEMYQAVSGEIVLDRLIERLMTVVVESAGAVRGLLLLPRDGDMRIVAEAATGDAGVTVNLRQTSNAVAELPQSVLNFVTRTQESIILDDALMPNAHSEDAYILRVRPRSILCLPLVKQRRIVGVLYLENTLASHIFTQDRLSILQLLASQAAISVENAELFQNIQKTQEHARRVGDELRRSFDMIPALAWRAAPDGTFEFSNQQWHDYTGISSEDARGGKWMRAFHPDDDDKVATKWQRLLEFRTSGEFEARMRRFDGEYRRFLVRVTPMTDEQGNIVMWHGTNTDIENLKRAEQAQEAFARVSRVTALGELTVSIAHEVFALAGRWPAQHSRGACGR